MKYSRILNNFLFKRPPIINAHPRIFSKKLLIDIKFEFRVFHSEIFDFV